MLYTVYYVLYHYILDTNTLNNWFLSGNCFATSGKCQVGSPTHDNLFSVSSFCFCCYFIILSFVIYRISSFIFLSFFLNTTAYFLVL